MSEAPPVEPAIFFPVMSAARVRSHVTGLLIYGFGMFLGITGIKSNLLRHRSIAVDIFVLFFSLLMFGLMAKVWLRDQGSQIVIHGNRIEVRSGRGQPRAAGLITNIIDLRAMQNVTQAKPWSYAIVFSNDRRIVFDRNIPNLMALIELLEQRTGKQFVIHRS